METTDKIKKVNELNNKIKMLEHFLFVVVEFDEKTVAIPSVNILMTKKVEVSVSLLGSRYFGLGTHKQEIEIPNDIRNDIRRIVQAKIKELKHELDNLIK